MGILGPTCGWGGTRTGERAEQGSGGPLIFLVAPGFPLCLPPQLPLWSNSLPLHLHPLAFALSPLGPPPTVGPFAPATVMWSQDQGNGVLLWWEQPELLNVNQKVVISPYKPANQIRGSGHAL